MRGLDGGIAIFCDPGGIPGAAGVACGAPGAPGWNIPGPGGVRLGDPPPEVSIATFASRSSCTSTFAFSRVNKASMFHAFLLWRGTRKTKLPCASCAIEERHERDEEDHRE